MTYDEALIGRRFTDLEFEEKARVRSLMRAGRVWIKGSGPARTVEATTPELKPSPTNLLRLETGDFTSGRIVFTPEGGGEFVGTLEEINALLPKLGYKPIAVRRNMMSRKPYIEAEDTPGYMSPSRESYWSM